MTELLQLQKTHKVLEVGTGSGYQAAILSLLAGEVYTIEIIPALGEMARVMLERLGYKNVCTRSVMAARDGLSERPSTPSLLPRLPGAFPQP
jgi:protein-L-isoaspartate(D-aspartate) O-methyltransferase